MDSICLSQDREKWRAVVKMTMNYHVPHSVREFLTLLFMKDYAQWAYFVS